MTDLLDLLANPAFWVAVLRIATPLIFGTLGVLLCERAGVLNLGIEGIMVAGAFAGWLAVYSGAPLWVGVGVAALAGAMFGLLHAFLTFLTLFILLRSGDETEGSLEPAPTLLTIEHLIDQIRAAGVPVDLDVVGERGVVPAGVDLSAYRIVQEALTNVIKHAGTSHAAVVLEYRPDDLLITVPEEGRPAAGPGGPGGRGLIGLRERVGLYGGELDAGPRPGGGWRVRARIPLEASARLGGPAEGGEPAGPVRPERGWSPGPGAGSPDPFGPKMIFNYPERCGLFP